MPRGLHDQQRLSPFHRLAERIAVGDVDQVAAAVKNRQGRKVHGRVLGPKQAARRGLHQLGHRPTRRAASCLSWAMTLSSICRVVFIWESIGVGWEYVEYPMALQSFPRLDPFGHGLCLIEFLGRGYDEIATGEGP